MKRLLIFKSRINLSAQKKNNNNWKSKEKIVSWNKMKAKKIRWKTETKRITMKWEKIFRAEMLFCVWYNCAYRWTWDTIVRAWTHTIYVYIYIWAVSTHHRTQICSYQSERRALTKRNRQKHSYGCNMYCTEQQRIAASTATATAFKMETTERDNYLNLYFVGGYECKAIGCVCVCCAQSHTVHIHVALLLALLGFRLCC